MIGGITVTEKKGNFKLNIHDDGTVEALNLQDREEKKKKIHEALLATGIDPGEIPVLTVELLAEHVPAKISTGIKSKEAGILNPSASVIMGAML